MAIASRDDIRIAAVDDNARTELHLADEALRRALARELHDRVAQTLTALLIDLEQFKAEPPDKKKILTKVTAVQGSMREVLSSLRDLLRDLRGEGAPISGDLRESLARLAADFERRTGITSTLVVHPRWPLRITAEAASNLYRIVEEALANVARHSGAERVSIHLSAAARNELRVTITDYGRGFDRAEIVPGMGTMGMKERAVLLGARLWIDSFPDYGTTVHVTVARSAVTPPATTPPATTPPATTPPATTPPATTPPATAT